MGEEENWHNEETVANGCRKLKPLSKPVANSNSLEALGFTVEDLLPSSSSTSKFYASFGGNMEERISFPASLALLSVACTSQIPCFHRPLFPSTVSSRKII